MSQSTDVLFAVQGKKKYRKPDIAEIYLFPNSISFLPESEQKRKKDIGKGNTMGSAATNNCPSSHRE